MPHSRRTKVDPLDEIADAFDAGMSRIDSLEDQLRDFATREALRSLQEDMRGYVEESNKKQTDATKEMLGYSLAAAKSDIAAERTKLIRESLDSWVEEKLQPIVAKIIDEQQKLAAQERDALVRRWRERVAFGTAAVVLLWAIFEPFKSDNTPREMNRIGNSIERLQDIP